MKARFKPFAVTAAAAAATLAGNWSNAGTLATTSFDTDSYIPFRTNNPTSPEITLGAVNPGYNFNFGVIEFADLGSVPTDGPKFLAVDLEAFITLGDPPPGGGPPPAIPSPTGVATIKVVGLGESYNDDYATAPSASDWFDTFIGDPDADATASPTTAGTVYFDVTDVVNGWLADPSSNFGFGLVVTSGQSVELGASSDFLPSGSIAPVLTTVPEPASMLLLGVGALALTRRRR